MVEGAAGVRLLSSPLQGEIVAANRSVLLLTPRCLINHSAYPSSCVTNRLAKVSITARCGSSLLESPASIGAPVMDEQQREHTWLVEIDTYADDEAEEDEWGALRTDEWGALRTDQPQDF
eukprot:SAG11_NODE_545_length_8621_cov_25.321521_6_plen_120_part_00